MVFLNIRLMLVGLLVYILFSFIGCSGDSRTPDIVTADFKYEDTGYGSFDGFPIFSFNGETDLTFIGGFNLLISPADMKADLTPMRSALIGESYTVSGGAFFSITPCQDCLRINNVALDTDGRISLGFEIKHPFPKGNPENPPSAFNRLDLDIFDLALVIVPHNEQPNQFSLADVYTEIVHNADGYTQEISSIIGDDSALPYKICYESPDYNRFEMGTDYHPFNVIFSLADESKLFDLYLTCGYGASSNRFSRLTPTYFLPEFNRKSAWKVEIEPLTLNGQTATVEIDIYDWNHGATVANNYPDFDNKNHIWTSSDVSQVDVEVPDMFDGVINAVPVDLTTNGWDDPLTYQAQITNEKGLGLGKYTGIVKVIDSRTIEIPHEDNSLLHTPDGIMIETHGITEFSTYQSFQVSIESNVIEVTPPWLNSTAAAVRFYDDHVYVVDYQSWFHTYDVSDPLNPIWLNCIRITNTGYVHIEISDRYVYVSSPGDGITIIDIETPESPVIVNVVITPGYSYDTKILNGYAFVADCQSGLTIVSIDPPASAHVVNNVAISGLAMGIDVSGEFAYVGLHSGDLIIVDINPVQNAHIIKTVESAGSSSIVKYSNGYVYIAGRNYGQGAEPGRLKVFKANPPDLTHQVYETTTPGNAWGLDISGSYAYIADCWAGIRIFDIAVPESTVLLNTVDCNANPRDIHVVNGYAYVADAGLTIFDIDPPEHAYLARTVDKLASVSGIELSDNYVYVADATGLQVVRIDTPETAQIVKSVYLPGTMAHDVYVDNGYAYVAGGWGGIHVINVSSPENAVYVRTVQPWDPNLNYAYRVYVQDNHAYVIDPFRSELLVVDINPPENAHIVSSYQETDPNSRYLSVFVLESYAYVADSHYGLRFFDINPPESVDRVNTVYTTSIGGGIDSVYVADGIAYCPGTTYMHFINITNVYDPEILNSISILMTHSRNSNSINVQNGLAYISRGDLGVTFVNIESINDAYVDIVVDVHDFAHDALLSDGYLYIADQTAGMSIFKM